MRGVGCKFLSKIVENELTEITLVDGMGLHWGNKDIYSWRQSMQEWNYWEITGNHSLEVAPRDPCDGGGATSGVWITMQVTIYMMVEYAQLHLAWQ